MHSSKKAAAMKSEDLLIIAATRLFAESGLDGVSVKEIAESAGVNVALISYHFGGKLGLYRKCLEQLGQSRLVAVKKILVSPTSVADLELRLRMFVEEMIDFNMEQTEVAALVHRACEMENEGVEDIFRATFLKVFQSLESFLKTAKRKSFINSNVDPFMTTMIFFSVLAHTTRMDKAHKKYFHISFQKPAERKKLIKQMIRVLMDGIKSRERGRK